MDKLLSFDYYKKLYGYKEWYPFAYNIEVVMWGNYLHSIGEKSWALYDDPLEKAKKRTEQRKIKEQFVEEMKRIANQELCKINGGQCSLFCEKYVGEILSCDEK